MDMDNNGNLPLPVDDKFLQEMGLYGLEGEEKRKYIEGLMRVINSKVAERLAEIITEEQAKKFEKFSEDTDNEEIAKWFEKNVPNYHQILLEETEKLRDKVKASVDKAME
ncbi:hypothetical protein A3J32_03315 [Candidatus Saccharibacteria bacterium RIFCSPLOWO2_02_FULL_46_7]|nr:MAG: hypothetical protein A3J32_03315 [Candidatus Saccharibacteria bacterium RIFCSPLOWO2_02_FULL_46_7]